LDTINAINKNATFDSAPFDTESSGMITKLLHTRYRVNDLEKTAAFYKDILGLKEVSRHTSPRGSTLAFFQAPDSEEQIELCHYPKSGPVVVQPDLTHIAFEVDDLDAFAKAAAAKGCPLSDGPTVTGSGSKIAFIDGPEGYEFELIEKKKS
jgi:lactoylglutathione lyase